MTDTPVEIPDRAAFRAAEVCEIAQIPPYVLRSWEKEFPGLGAAARPGGPRIYRRSDVEQILRIKQLVFSEGLTLAGVRHRIEGEPPDEDELPAEPEPAPAVVPVVPDEVRSGVSQARRELRELLDILTGERPATDATPLARTVEPTASAAEQPMSAPAADAAPATTVPATIAPETSRARETAGNGDELPLLNGVLDTPRKPKRSRRTTKQAPWGPPSEVE